MPHGPNVPNPKEQDNTRGQSDPAPKVWMMRSIRKNVSTFPPLLLLLACMHPPLFGASPVILLVADDGGYAEFGFQQPFVSKAIEFKTPHLDALAEESIVFPQGYVSGTVCSPTRAGLISDRYQQRLGYE